jgi:hypothetical protein
MGCEIKKQRTASDDGKGNVGVCDEADQVALMEPTHKKQ